jgi:hypothetical protein
LSVVALIEFYFKLIICITIPEEPEAFNHQIYIHEHIVSPVIRLFFPK